jgi:DNA-directed RNA polymerase specialized sigma24 family protein
MSSGELLQAIDELGERSGSEGIGGEPISSSELLRAIASLDERSKLVIGLRFFDGKKPLEIAETLQMTRASVDTRTSRALTQMREWLTKSRGGR